MAKKSTTRKKVATLTHDDAKRTNIPTAELESVVSAEDKSPVRVAIAVPVTVFAGMGSSCGVLQHSAEKLQKAVGDS